jgi:branched-chain amino acid transport system substrate-binding protein
VEVVQADHQNRPDVGSTVARQWLDRDGIDVVVDVPTSSVALAVNTLVRERNKVYLNSGAATSDLTGAQCSPNTIHWTYDTWMLARSTGGAMVRAGGQSWFFITADYAFGHALERDTSEFVRSQGGQILGGVRTPFPGTTDFSSFLQQAQRSRAQVIGLANAGGDTINSIKQAAEFRITRGGRVKLAGLLVFVTDVHALGLEVAQGLVLSETFYWDLNDKTRAFTQRLGAMPGGVRPSMVQAGCYSPCCTTEGGGRHGRGSGQGLGTDCGERMKAMPTNDDAFGDGSIRPDGRKLHPCYPVRGEAGRARAPARGTYKLARTVPATRPSPTGRGGCTLVRS